MFFIALFTIAGAGLSLLQPFEYAAKAKLLVVQESKETWVDPYQLQKSNEYVADVLAKVVSTNSFLVEVLNANSSVNKNLFVGDLETQLKAWNKSVKPSAAAGKGVLNISVFQTDRGQADQIIRGIIQALKANHTQYHGLGEKISVKVIDQPFVTLQPAKPDIPMNIALGAVFGLIFALTYIYLFPGEGSAISLWPFSRKAKAPANGYYQPYPYPDQGAPQPYQRPEAYYPPAPRSEPAAQPAQPAYRPAPGIGHDVAPARPANLPFEPEASGHERLSAYNRLMDEGLSYEDVVKQGRMDNLRK